MKTSPSRPGRAATALLTATLAAGWALSGCSASLLPKPPAAAARYTLDGARATLSPRGSPAASAPVLLLTQPLAAAGYDSARMLYRRQPQQLEAFAFHEWAVAPARLLAPLLLQALQGRSAFRAVLLAPTSGEADLRLETELVRLEQDFSTQPSTVRLTLRAVLIATATRRVIATQVFDATVAAQRDDPVAGVAAAQQATQLLLDELSGACAGWAQPGPGGAQ